MNYLFKGNTLKLKKKHKDKKREIIKKYNLTANFYDDRYSKIQEEKYFLLLKDFELKDKIILDAGTGTGILFFYLIKKKKVKNSLKFSFVGIDISIKMLTIFKEKLKKLNHNNTNLILADLEHLPIRQNVFNVLFSLTALQNLSDITKGIIELFRVGKNSAFYNFSILNKNLNLNEIESFLSTKSELFTAIKKHNLEDIIFQGKIIKNLL